MIIRVLTLFPEMFSGPMGSSIIHRAKEAGIIDMDFINIRDFSINKHKKVDDYPYGGGPGMVMTPQPIIDCYNNTIKSLGLSHRPRTIYLSPKGKTFNQSMAIELSKESCIVLLCGHYEGIDQRAIDEIVTDEISIGDYVLTGGEIPAMVLIDAVTRLLPGALSHDESYEEESFYSGLLEYPQYTRPRIFDGRMVPEVLLSGDHSKIKQWRREQSLLLTHERRPDLLEKLQLSNQDKKMLEKLKVNKNI